VEVGVPVPHEVAVRVPYEVPYEVVNMKSLFLYQYQIIYRLMFLCRWKFRFLFRFEKEVMEYFVPYDRPLVAEHVTPLPDFPQIVTTTKLLTCPEVVTVPEHDREVVSHHNRGHFNIL